MGQSDWARIGVVSDFFHDAGAKIPAFQEIGRDLALSLDRGQSFSETVRGILFQKELPLMIEYGEVKSKLGSELEIYAEKNMGRFLSSGSQGHEYNTTLGVCLCGSCDCVTLCSHVAADLSKYGGPFMKTLKTYKVKAFTLIEMLVVLLIISVLLLLFVPNLTKQKTP